MFAIVHFPHFTARTHTHTMTDKKPNKKPSVAPSTHLIAGGIAGFAEACTCHRESRGRKGSDIDDARFKCAHTMYSRQRWTQSRCECNYPGEFEEQGRNLVDS